MPEDAVWEFCALGANGDDGGLNDRMQDWAVRWKVHALTTFVSLPDIPIPTPIHLPFEPILLLERNPVITALLEQRPIDSAKSPLLHERRRKAALAAFGALVAIVQLVVISSFSIWIAAAFLVTTAMLLTAALLWPRTGWYLIPGGVVHRSARVFRSVRRRRFVPAEWQLTARSIAGDRWAVKLDPREEGATDPRAVLELSEREFEALLGVWQSRRTPPSEEQLAGAL